MHRINLQATVSYDGTIRCVTFEQRCFFVKETVPGELIRCHPCYPVGEIQSIVPEESSCFDAFRSPSSPVSSSPFLSSPNPRPMLRAERKQLVRELLKGHRQQAPHAIDARSAIQSHAQCFRRVEGTRCLDDERAGGEATEQRKKSEEYMRVFRERLWARVDFATYDDQVYAPLFERRTSADELRELIAFFKTKAATEDRHPLPRALPRCINFRLRAHFQTGRRGRGGDGQRGGGEKTGGRSNDEGPSYRGHGDRSLLNGRESLSQGQSYDALKPILSPTYIKTLPEKDGWGTPYRYSVSSDGAHYRLASAGADRQFEAGSDTIALFDEKSRPPEIRSASADSDIIYQDGAFVAGACRSSGEDGFNQ